jgi:hypothetical protein
VVTRKTTPEKSITATLVTAKQAGPAERNVGIAVPEQLPAMLSAVNP